MSQRIEEGLNDYAVFDWSVMSFVSEMLDEFSRYQDPREAIYHILERIGDIYQVDRVYICLFSSDEESFQTDIQWYKEEAGPVKWSYPARREQVLSIFQYGCLAKYDRVSDIQDAGARAYFEEMNVKASLEYLLVKNGYAFGWISLDDCHKTRHWETREIELLQTAAMLFRERTYRLE